MRRAVWGFVAIAFLGVAGHANADDSGGFFTRLFGGKSKAETKKEEARAKEASADSRSEAELVAAKNAYFERLKVCNKLREIALEKGDEELLRKAEQLEIRVWDVYQGRMRRLAGGGSALSAEQALDSRLPPDTAAGRGRSTGDSSSAARR
ncbi:MAG: hypothetical protein U0793_26645 [Gemmataceae bacterium]